MARQHRKRPSQSRKGGRQGRTQASYRHGLKDAIGKQPGCASGYWARPARPPRRQRRVYKQKPRERG